MFNNYDWNVVALFFFAQNFFWLIVGKVVLFLLSFVDFLVKLQIFTDLLIKVADFLRIFHEITIKMYFLAGLELFKLNKMSENLLLHYGNKAGFVLSYLFIAIASISCFFVTKYALENFKNFPIRILENSINGNMDIDPIITILIFLISIILIGLIPFHISNSTTHHIVFLFYIVFTLCVIVNLLFLIILYIIKCNGVIGAIKLIPHFIYNIVLLIFMAVSLIAIAIIEAFRKDNYGSYKYKSDSKISICKKLSNFLRIILAIPLYIIGYVIILVNFVNYMYGKGDISRNDGDSIFLTIMIAISNTPIYFGILVMIVGWLISPVKK